jgi:hypothetical protein
MLQFKTPDIIFSIIFYKLIQPSDGLVNPLVYTFVTKLNNLNIDSINNKTCLYLKIDKLSGPQHITGLYFPIVNDSIYWEFHEMQFSLISKEVKEFSNKAWELKSFA